MIVNIIGAHVLQAEIDHTSSTIDSMRGWVLVVGQSKVVRVNCSTSVYIHGIQNNMLQLTGNGCPLTKVYEVSPPILDPVAISPRPIKKTQF